MDRVRKPDQRQRMNFGEGGSNNNQARDQPKQTGKSSHSKFNRILGNLERSILGQFNHGEKNPTEPKPTTSAKRKQIIHLSQQQTTAGGATHGPIESLSQLHRLHEETATQQQRPVKRDRITSSMAGSVAKSASEKFGKLTLNNKSQLEESPRQPSSLCSSLATSRLSIPPPHANDEARSMNQTLLFGNADVQLVPEHHQRLLDTVNRADVSASSATMNAIQSRAHGGQVSNTVKSDRLLADQQYTQRLNSSPATSARSLPVTKPNSASRHTELRDGNSKKSTSQEDEEESGFATYQSRRALLQNFQKKQQQLESDSNSNDNMILNRMNYYPNHQINHAHGVSQMHHSMRQNQVMTNHHRQNGMMMMPNIPYYGYQARTMSSNQVPILPLRNSNASVHQNGYNINQRVPPAHSGYLFNQNQEHVPSFPFQQSNFIDNHQLSQMQGMSEQRQPTDSSQQIYANAPPKPRRYQYYDGPGTTTAAIGQPVVTVSQVMAQRSNASTGTAPMMTMAPSSRPPAHTLQPLPNQQLVFNHRGQLCPQVQHSPMLRSGISSGNLNSSGLSNLRPILQYSRNEHDNQQLHPPLGQNNIHQPHGFQMIKSKSSLDASDIMRFKQNRQSQSRVAHEDHQLLQTQPLYGYRQDEKRIHQTMNIHLPLDYNQNHRPVLSVPSSNLQRSKSVTHLLPESNQDYRQNFTHTNHSEQIPLTGHEYPTSASTNRLNDIGMSQHNSMTNDCSRIHLINQKPVLKQQVPTQQPPHIGAGLRVERAQQSLHRAPMSSANNNIGANQFHRAKSMAALNSDSLFSIKTTRHSPGSIIVSQEGGGFRKPSLDDQIKHLLIGGLDNPIALRASGIAGGVGANNRETNAIYQASDGNNRHLGVAPSHALTVFRGGPEVAKPPNWTQKVHTDQNYTDLSKQIQVATRHPAHNNVFDQVDFNADVAQSDQNQVSSANNNSLAKLNVDMGNRQQRQYRLNDSDTRKNDSNPTRRHSDANSQLIVDLTTPRVLAKTQTTLLPMASQPSGSWSMNEVGLPQMSTTVQSVDTSSSQTIEQRSNSHSSATSSNLPEKDKKPLEDQQSAISNEHQFSEQLTDEISSLERSAPYYYSDLKSREQREALRNIVQQKSLSPPPQLLSRSTDQSSTRLALRSATLHPAHARTLSDNLAQRQRAVNDMKCAGSSLSQSQMIESSSVSNIAKNIDKLFERPLDNKNSMTTASSVDNNKESRDVSHISLDQVSRSANAESISSGYCSSDLRSRNTSKSRSLDNLSQKSLKEEGLPMKCSFNPVYENIRCSNQLLSAINNTTIGFSSEVVNKSANIKLMAAASTNSDESMDSILGSSLEDSDSCSDMIDEITISSTDNHLHDISNLIEQLKTNQSKMAEEYKLTLVRIAKTINSKLDESKNSEKLARRLQLLELKSKKCESRSKNQLALIQMMEKVLRQSKLRAMSNRSSIAPQKFNTSPASDDTAALSSIDSSELRAKSNGQNNRPEHPIASKSAEATNSKLPMTREEQDHPKSPVQDGNEFQSKAITPPEIIRAVVIEKEANSAVMSKATVDHHASPVKNRLASPSSATDGLRAIKSNAVTKKILDIEARNGGNINWNKNVDVKSNTDPFYVNSNNDSDPSSERYQDAARGSKNPDHPDDDDDVLSRDDDDFIEFLSNDNSSHRSQFEASQFSASDFNASTSTSESSTSCSAVNGSLNSLTPARKISSSKDRSTKKSGGTNSPITIGILKNRRCSYDGASSPGNKQTWQSLATKTSDKKSTQVVANEKFKNVLGNVVDVDICPMDSLSQGCSPVNHQSQTSCSN